MKTKTNETLKAFAENICETVKPELPDGYTIRIQEREGEVYFEITATSSDTGMLFKVSRAYAFYEQGGTKEEITENLVSEARLAFDVKALIKSKEALNHLTCRLINKESNKEKLKDMPYQEVADLALVYYIDLNVLGLANQYVSVNNDLVKSMGISKEELFARGEKIIHEITDPYLKPLEAMLDLGDTDTKILVLSNSNKNFGACMALRKDVDEAIRGRLGEYYLIPSSVHEMLAIPKDMTSVDEIKFMIHEINQKEVAPDEVLSDNLYEVVNGDLRVVA